MRLWLVCWLMICGSAAMSQDIGSSVEEKRALFLQQQETLYQKVREQQKIALEAAERRQFPDVPAKEVYVDNVAGDDRHTGLSSVVSDNNGPVRTLQKAASLLKPGDTLHFAITNKPYRESLRLHNEFGGLADRPITIDGHGATILGCDPLKLDSWEGTDTPGLFRSTHFAAEFRGYPEEALLMRMFFVLDGHVQRMGRTSKGTRAAFKSPSELKAGEWTYVANEKAFYIKVEGSLSDANVEAPYRRDGVEIAGNRSAVKNVVIKNLIVARVLNDGFNLHGTAKNIHLKNIASYECGDDGISPHEACEVSIDGFWAIGNSVGIANATLSRMTARNVCLQNNFAYQFLTLDGPITKLSHSVIISPEGTTPISHTHCLHAETFLEHVEVLAPDSQRCYVQPDATLKGEHITSLSPTWDVFGHVEFTKSIFGRSNLYVRDNGVWKGRENLFESHVKIPRGDASQTSYSSEEPLSTLKQHQPDRGADLDLENLSQPPQSHPAAGDIGYLLTRDLKPLIK